MALIRDDRYEEMASAYQFHLIALLDTTLKQNGITEVKKRRKIVGTFLSQLGQFHDQGWLRSSAGSEQAYPLLCFTKTFLNTETAPEDLGDVLATSSFFSFQEYAASNTEMFFDNDPDAKVETGSVGASEL
ncbi:MAG: hypothetical protein QM758_10255 [Armatimonas sp.]